MTILDYDRDVRQIKLIDALRGPRKQAREKCDFQRNELSPNFAEERRRWRRGKEKCDFQQNELPPNSDEERRRWHRRKEKHKQLAKMQPEEIRDEVSKRHVHEGFHFFAAGSGRFAHADILSHMLWQAQNLAQAICNILDTCEERHPPDSAAFDCANELAQRPQYWISAQPEAFAPLDINPLLELIKTNNFVRSILGVTKADYVRWIGTWSLMEDSTAQLLMSTCSHLFGNVWSSFRCCQTFSVIVSLMLEQPQKQPVLVRFSFGQDTRNEFAGCLLCRNNFLIIDYIGPSGALKFRLPFSLANDGRTWTSLKEFEENHSLLYHMIFAKWARIAGASTGFARQKHYRRCFCSGSLHSKGFKEHYIDMAAEESSRNERWDPNADIMDTEDVFESHPLETERNTYCVENNDSSDQESKDDHWDPNGEEIKSLEVFEPNPDDIEDEVEYVSKPKFLRLRR